MTYVPGVGLVPYVPGYPALSVTENAANDVTREYECQISRADTPNQSLRVAIDWDRMGILAVLAVGGLAAIADGAFLWFLAWVLR
jgi:hypothetical protein